MLNRALASEILANLKDFPAVVLLGPRQVGKTTLALQIAGKLSPKPLYLDLENPADLAVLEEPLLFFQAHDDRLVILDEIQRLPNIFATLRSVIDQRRRAGKRAGQFLMLGSASLDLLQQSSESLAGRIVYRELGPLYIGEVAAADIDKLWLRGGFPESFLARTDSASFRWRQAFIRNYLERDIPQFGPRIPAALLRRFWTMLAHQQGTQINMAQLAGSLAISGPTVRRYVELLEDLLLIRTIRPWSGNIGKRLVKTPKIYVRDSGITHALLHLQTLDDLLSHLVTGLSWEGFVIENLLALLPEDATPWFYRTAAGAEIDLVIEQGTSTRVAVEIKRSLSPTVGRGFHAGIEDIQATHRYIAYPGHRRFPLAHGVTVMPIRELTVELQTIL